MRGKAVFLIIKKIINKEIAVKEADSIYNDTES